MLRQSAGQTRRVKTVTILLGAYFSILVAMLIFTGIFVYFNLSLTADSVAASSQENKIVKEEKTPGLEKPEDIPASAKAQSASLKQLR
jgi:hypothetical protein